MPTVAEYKSQAEGFEREGQLTKARAVYEHLIKHLEASAAIWKELPLYVKAGDVASQLGDAEAAIGFFERAGARYAELGEVERVIAACRKVLKEDAERLSVYRRLAAELLKHNYVDQARRLMLDLARHSGKKASIEQLERLAIEPPADVRAAIEKGFEAEAEAEGEEEEEDEAPAAEQPLVVRTAADELRAEVGADAGEDEEEEGAAAVAEPPPAPEPEPVVAAEARPETAEKAEHADEPEEEEEEEDVEEVEETPAEAPGLASMLSGAGEPAGLFLDLGEDEESAAVEAAPLEREAEPEPVPEAAAEAPAPVEPPKKKKRKRVRRRRPAGPLVRVAAVAVLVIGAGATLFATGVISLDSLPLVGGGGQANVEPEGEPADPLDENQYVPGGPEPAPTIALEAFPPTTGSP